MYSSLYTLVDYTAERVGAGSSGFVPSIVLVAKGVTQLYES
jgi:hypothetical protein